MNTAKDMEPKLLYDGYERRSSEDSDDKQVASIASQDRELKELAKRLNLKVRQYVSESKSAYKIGREVFNQMITDIEDSKINAVLAWHANRLCRNAFDAGRLIYLMDEGKLLEIRTPTRVYINTPEDKFMLNLEFGMSKKDSDDKGIVVKRGLKEKAINGWRPGVAPEGYLNDKAGDRGERKIFTDPERFPFIKKIFELKYHGTPVREIERIAKDEWHYLTRPKKRLGNKPLTKGMIYQILTNSFYCGRYEYPLGTDTWYEGKHEKAVEPEIFDQIQIILGRKNKPKPKTHEFAYTGLMKCPCGSAITAEEKYQIICPTCRVKFTLTRKNSSVCPSCKILIADMANPTVLHYIYYHCTRKKDLGCTQGYVAVSKLEEQIAQKLEKLDISETFMNWAIKQIERMNEEDIKFTENKTRSIKEAHDLAHQKLDNLIQLKISALNTNGNLLSDEQYQKEKTNIDKEIKQLDELLAKSDNRRLKSVDKIAEKFDYACYAKEKFAKGDVAKKREILENLGSNITISDRKLDLELPEYFKKIQEMKEEEPSIAYRVEPNDNAATIAQLEASWASNQSLLRD